MENNWQAIPCLENGLRLTPGKTNLLAPQLAADKLRALKSLIC